MAWNRVLSKEVPRPNAPYPKLHRIDRAPTIAPAFAFNDSPQNSAARLTHCDRNAESGATENESIGSTQSAQKRRSHQIILAVTNWINAWPTLAIMSEHWLRYPLFGRSSLE